MNATVLVTPVDSIEAHCAAMALQGAGITATATPATGIAAVVEFLLPGECARPADALCPDNLVRPLLLVAPTVDVGSMRLAELVGAVGLVSWDASTEVLAEAVRDLLRGESSLPSPPDGAADPLHGLTSRELEIVHLLGEGASNEAIARTLGISYHTARTHVAHVLAKLGVSHRYAAAAVARRGGRTGVFATSGARSGGPP